jgi:hypothetical protein
MARSLRGHSFVHFCFVHEVRGFSTDHQYTGAQSVVNPFPRHALDRTDAIRSATSGLTIFFVVTLLILNALLLGPFFTQIYRGPSNSGVLSFIFILVQLLTLGALIVCPGIILAVELDVAKTQAWNRSCDTNITAIIDARATGQSSSTPSLVKFSTTTSGVQLFTYSLDSSQKNMLFFSLYSIDAPPSIFPSTMYPSLQNISYDLTNNIILGNCTTSGGQAEYDITPCLQATFRPGVALSFNISSFTPGQTPVNTSLRVEDEALYNPPRLILQTVEPPNNSLGAIVLQAITDSPWDCTQLKVCVSGLSGEGPAVGPEVLAPMGTITDSQTTYALSCTRRK